MPHVRELYRKYESRGLVVIGIHTPRTEDERNIAKLRAAVERLDIRFPVVSDNSGKIWNDYRCDVWPTVFVVDRIGEIRYSRGGVTRIGDLESTIQSLLERQ
jgi:peroxiredoxin